ncbi:hypothetical protein SAMN05216404_11627 [Nitrosospira multiformis]|uniref:Uncharacterized protein n=1 Tax=Nitrosospira multiformis TaxID=1231 RepID=A0A1H8NG08_9PROT|nr:hypothetical protein SAMN05216404_11627 [Nitrosospira multiformis]
MMTCIDADEGVERTCRMINRAGFYPDDRVNSSEKKQDENAMGCDPHKRTEV